jgi:hypothetical protein
LPTAIDEDTAEQIREGKIVRDGGEDVWDVEKGEKEEESGAGM